MSNVIDERIVEMRFDNRQFERNVSTTLSTLDKLKQKLNLNGAAKGIEEIGKAADKVDFSGMIKGIDGVQVRFSHLQATIQHQIDRIVDKVVDASRRFVAALTTAPVSDGFREYEMTLNAVQTTMAATGKTAEEVEEELKKLDEYADKTIYSTSDMLNNLPKFTNAGVDLEVATKAMIGIANATAIAGGDASKASIAFYNLGQSISNGFINRQDWKSIEIAGIHTMELKQRLVDAAVAAGTLTKAGEDLYVAGNKSYSLNQLYVTGLQEGWATTEVMLEVLGDYGDETTDIGKRAYAAAQDIKTFTMMMESLKATAGTGWKDTWQIIFGDLDEAKKFWTGITNFISGILTATSDWRNNVLSGIFEGPVEKIKSLIGTTGRYSEALDKVNDVTNAVTKTTKDYEDVVNRILKGEFGNGETRVKKLTDAGYDWAHAQNLVNEKLGDTTRHATTYKEAQQQLNKAYEITIDDLAKMTDAQLEHFNFTKDEIAALRELEDVAKKAGFSLSEVMADPSLLSGRNLLINSFKNIGKTIGNVADGIKEAYVEIFNPPSAEEFQNRIVKGIYNAIATFHKFTKELMENKDAVNKIKRTFKGLFAVLDIFTTITKGGMKIAFELLSEILKAFDLDILEVTARVGDALVAFRDWLLVDNKLVKSIKNVIKAVAKFIKRVYDLPIVQKFISKISDAITALSEGFTFDAEMFAKAISVIRNALSKCSDKVREWYDAFKNSTVGKKFSDSIDTIKKSLEGCGKALSNWYKSFKDNPIVSKFADTMDAIGESLSNFGQQIKDWYESVTGQDFSISFDLFGNLDFIGSARNIIEGLALGIWEGIKKLPSLLVSIGERMWEAFCNFWGIASPAKLMIGAGGFIIAGLAIGIINGIPELKDAFTQVWSKLTGIFKGIDLVTVARSGTLNIVEFFKKRINWTFGQINKDVITSSTNFYVKYGDKIQNGLNAFSEFLAGVVKVLLGSEEITLPAILDLTKKILGVIALFKVISILDNLTLGFSSIGEGIENITKSIKWRAIGDALKSMALAIGALALAIVIISGLPDADRVTHAIHSMAGLLIILGVLVAGMAMFASKLDGGLNLGVAVGSVVGMALAIFIMVAALKKLDTTEYNNLNRSVAIIMGFLYGIVTYLILIGSLCNKKSALSNAIIIVTMLAALKTILEVIESYDKFNFGRHIKGLVAVIGMLTYLAIVMAIATSGIKRGANTTGLALLLLSAVIAIKVMLGAVEDLSEMDTEKMKQGISGLSTLFIGIGIMLALVNLTSKNTVLAKGEKNVSSFAGLAMALLAVSASIALLGILPTEVLNQGLRAVVAILAMFAVLMYALGKTGQLRFSTIVTVLFGMGLIIAELAVIVFALRDVPWQNAVGAAGAISILLLAMAGCMVVLSKINIVNMTNINNALGYMVFLSIIAGLIGFILSKMTGVDGMKAVPQVIAISTLLGVMTLCLSMLDKLGMIDGKNMAKAIVSLAALGLVAAEIAHILTVVAKFDGVAAIPQVLALSILLGVMTLCLGVLDSIGIMGFKNVAIAVAGMAGLGLVVWLIGHILNNMTFDGAKAIGQVTALSIILIALSGVLAVLAFILPIIAQAGKIPIDQLGVGILAFLVLVGGLGAVAALVAEMFACVADDIMEKLPNWATKLSEFMDNLGPFLAGAESIKAGTGENIKALMDAIGELVKSNLIDNIASLVGLDSFAGLSEKLVSFGQALVDFSNVLTEGKIDTEKLKVAAEAGLAIAALYEALPKKDGWLQTIFGEETSLTSFGLQLKHFGAAIVGFSESLGETGIRKDLIDDAVAAAQSIAALYDYLPSHGGVIQDIFGKQDLSVFGNQLRLFGSAIIGFSNQLELNGGINTEMIEQAGTAAGVVAALYDTIPSEGGWAQTIFGSQDLASFGRQLKLFGWAIVEFSNSVSSEGAINETGIQNALKVATRFIDFGTTLPETESVWGRIKGFFAGDQMTFTELGTLFSEFGAAITKFSDSLSTVDTGRLVTAITQANRIFTFIKDLDAYTPGDGAAKFATALEDLGSVSIDSFLNSFSNTDGKITLTMTNLVGFVVDAINDGKTLVGEAFQGILDDCSNLIINNSDVFYDRGWELTTEVKEGVRDRDTENGVAAEFTIIIGNALTAIYDLYDAFFSSGEYLGEGLILGIGAKIQDAYDAGFNLGQAAVQGEKDGQQSKSPSKLTEMAGNWFGEGLVIGIEGMTQSVYNSGFGIGETATTGLSDALSNIGNVTSFADSITASVTPVYDTSSLSGYNFDLGANISAYMSKPVDSIASIMTKTQGKIVSSNSEVLDAINGLREDLSNIFSGDDQEIALYVDSKKLATSLAKPMNRQLNILSKKGAY